MRLLDNGLIGTLALIAVSTLLLVTQADSVMAQDDSRANRYRLVTDIPSAESTSPLFKPENKSFNANASSRFRQAPQENFGNTPPALDSFTNSPAHKNQSVQAASFTAARKNSPKHMMPRQSDPQQLGRRLEQQLQQSLPEFGQQYGQEPASNAIQEFGQGQDYSQPPSPEYGRQYGQDVRQEYSQEYRRPPAPQYSQDYHRQPAQEYGQQYGQPSGQNYQQQPQQFDQQYEQQYSENYPSQQYGQQNTQQYERNYDEIYGRRAEYERGAGQNNFEEQGYAGTFLDRFAEPEHFPFRDQFEAFPARTGYDTLYGKAPSPATRPTEALFGVRPCDVCDEWSKFGPCVEADYIEGCGGLKLNPRRRILKCNKPSREPCDEVVGLQRRSKRYSGELDCGCQETECRDTGCRDRGCRDKRKRKCLNKNDVDYGNSSDCSYKNRLP